MFQGFKFRLRQRQGPKRHRPPDQQQAHHPWMGPRFFILYPCRSGNSMLCVLTVSDDYLPRILPWPRKDHSGPLGSLHKQPSA